MPGDYSRRLFRRAKHYSGVLMQQGRVQLDADFNEQVWTFSCIARRRKRSTLLGERSAAQNSGFQIGAAPRMQGSHHLSRVVFTSKVCCVSWKVRALTLLSPTCRIPTIRRPLPAHRRALRIAGWVCRTGVTLFISIRGSRNAQRSTIH